MADPRNPEAKFRSNVLAAISHIGETVSMRLDSTERATAANTEAIAQLGTKIDRLTDAIGAQTQSIERLERGIDKMVTGINSQRETLNDFLKLCTKQADIIGRLAEKAS